MASDSNSCVFCEIVAGRETASIVYRDVDVTAFMDIQPVNAGHVLVVPNVHACYLADIDSELAAHVFDVGCRVAAAIRKSGVRCEGINVFLADGVAAGQEIFHVHLHVFPRFNGDGFGLKHSSQYYVLPDRSTLEATARRIRADLESKHVA